MQFLFISMMILLPLADLNSSDSFLSNDEYAKMLYKNPRGVGCHKCHGERGEGKEISFFMKDNKKISLMGPRINNLTQKQFIKALKSAKRLMPEYFLTKEEKAYLYYYITKKDKNDKK